MNKKERNELIAKRIRKFRKDKGLTQKQLGELIGISATRIAQYENGYRNPKMNVIQKIAEKLNISILEIINRNEENTISIVETDKEGRK